MRNSKSNSFNLSDRLNKQKEASLTKAQPTSGLVTLSDKKVITLLDGELVEFDKLITLSAEQVKTKTRVHSANPRYQEDLTPENLKDITCDIKENQRNACFAVLAEDGFYEFLDGSRRRAGAQLVDAGLTLYYRSEPLEYSIAFKVANHLGKSQQQSHRDFGFKYLQYMQANECEQQDCALAHGVAPATVTRCIKATEIDDRWKALFISFEGFSHPNFDELAKIEKAIIDDEIKLSKDDFFTSQDEHLKQVVNPEQQELEKVADRIKEKFKLLAHFLKQDAVAFKKSKKQPKPEKKPLFEFDSNSRAAHFTREKETTQITLRGVSNDCINDVLALVKSELDKRYS